MTMIAVPPDFAAATMLREGRAGRAWTLVRCVDYWLWALSAGLTEDPARCGIIVRQLI